MRRFGLAAAAVVALSACDTQVPDSGVGFGDPAEYAARQATIQAERNMQLADAMTIRPPEATGAPPASALRPSPAQTSYAQASPVPAGGVTPAELAAAGIGTAAAAAAPTASTVAPFPASEPVITPAAAPVGAPLDATGVGASYASNTVTELSNTQQIAAVSAPGSQPSAAAAVPSRPGNTGPDVVAYALQSNHPVGQSVYPRTLPSASRAARRCATYASDDMAQLDFLEAGGPVKDRRGIDPDGDGYACGWSPARYRQAVGG